MSTKLASVPSAELLEELASRMQPEDASLLRSLLVCDGAPLMDGVRITQFKLGIVRSFVSVEIPLSFLTH
jgi:hypothetical protein